MSEEERTAFYQEIPPWLRHCPFAYVMQQNSSEQRRIMQQQQQQQMRGGNMAGGGGAGAGGGGPLPGGMTQQQFAAQQQQMMNDPAKRAKMTAFSARFVTYLLVLLHLILHLLLFFINFVLVPTRSRCPYPNESYLRASTIIILVLSVTTSAYTSPNE